MVPDLLIHYLSPTKLPLPLPSPYPPSLSLLPKKLMERARGTECNQEVAKRAGSILDEKEVNVASTGLNLCISVIIFLVRNSLYVVECRLGEVGLGEIEGFG
jgi:hypothetical protein